MGVAPDEAEHDAEEADADEADTDQVERIGRPRDSDSRHQARGSSTTPTGTLSQKMYCQAHPVVTAPPTSGPMATALPPMAPQMPSAALRRSGRRPR